MPTPAPTSAAPAAAPAVPVPPAPVAPAAAAPSAAPAPATPATPPADPKTPGRGNRIFSLLAQEEAREPGKKAEPKKKEDAPAAPATPTPATPAATPAVPDKPIKAEKKPAISKRPAPPVAAPAPAATPAAPVAPKTDEEWEAGLVEAEKQLLSDAEEAEKHLPQRKGLKEQAKKFIKEHVKYLETHDDADDGGDGEAAYNKWLQKNRPGLSEAEQRTVSENRIASRVSQPLERRAQELEHEIFVRDEEPKVRQEGQRVVSELNGTAMPKEILDFAEAHGVDVAKKEFADEIQIHNLVVNAAASDYQELIRLGQVNPKNGRPLGLPVTDRATDPARFEQHERLSNIIEKVNTEFVQAGKDLMRDGKWFCTRDEWNAGYKQHPDKYWTFTNKEIAQRSLAWVKPAIEATIKQRRQDLEGRGYFRKPYVPAPTAPAAVPAKPTNSAPGPGTSPVPAPTPNPPPANTSGARLANLLGAG